MESILHKYTSQIITSLAIMWIASSVILYSQVQSIHTRTELLEQRVISKEVVKVQNSEPKEDIIELKRDIRDIKQILILKIKMGKHYMKF